MKRNPFDEYLHLVNLIYMTFNDSIAGFEALKIVHERDKEEYLKNNKQATSEWYDQQEFTYGFGNRNDPWAIKLASVSMIDRHRNLSPGSLNTQIMGNSLVSLVYGFWEDRYRGQCADFLGIEKNKLIHDTMGDVRIIRNLIIHNKSIATDIVDKIKVLKWLKAGDEIVLCELRFGWIIEEIRVSIDEMRKPKGLRVQGSTQAP